MTNNRLPFIGSGRLQEAGALSTRKQDFNAHWQGNGFRHDATNIDMNPIIPLVGGTTVQETLERFHGLIISAGTGILSIGSVDGYIQGDYNVGNPTTPTLYDTFNAAFADTRLQNGGLILVLAGTYHLRTSVTVPAGITIMGELSGTTIIGEIQESPMFIVQKPNTSIDLVTDLPFDTGSNIDMVKFMNLTLIDNLEGSILFGEPSMTTVPMIQAQISSNLVCENVSFVGKVHSGSIPRTKTQAAIGYTGSGTIGTVLNIRNCYMDGLKIGISFTPSNNASDFLTVEHCKARIYGTEDVASQSAALNSFIVMSHCNAAINNNYFVGAGTYVNTFIDIVSGSGTATKLVVTGNYGKPNTLASGKIINDAAGTVFTSVVTGNAWGTTVDSPWYVVVGGGTGSLSLGDFNGVGAIDTILSIANTIPSFEATILVNPGTYTVTGSGSGNFINLKFIGNKHGKTYPIINLNLTSATSDTLGNRPLALGNYLQSLQFTSTSNKHSIRPGFNPTSASAQSAAHTLEVVDCLFTNVSLYALDLGSSSWTDTGGRVATTNIKVRDCFFLQDGTFSNTVSMALPSANEVAVENCYFTGNGFAFTIGPNGFTPGNASTISNVSIVNTICNLTGYTISGINNSLAKSYVYVNNFGYLKIDKCQFYADTQYASVSPISAGLTSTNSFSKFIHLLSTNINIDDSVFVGPDQTFTVASVAYAMPSLYCEPLNSARIRNSRFWVGSLPLQFSGSTILGDGDFRENIIVENCSFKSQSQTLLDFDLDAPSEDPMVQVIVRGCNFDGGVVNNRIFHVNTSLTSSGIVQIFAGDCYVSFTDNLIDGNLSSLSSVTNYAGLIIDNFENPAPGDQANLAVISGNTIYVSNSFTSANAAAGASCVLCRSNVISITDNLLSMFNQASISASFIGTLVMDNPGTASGTYSDAIVSGNIFTRRGFAGTDSDLARGYIQIASTSSSNRGFIVDNSFDSTTFNGSSTALIEDNTVFPNIWTTERNKNETKSLLMLNFIGNKAIATGSDIGSNVIIYGGEVSPSSIYSAQFDAITFNYKNTGNADQFRWGLPLHNILPPNVIITGVTYKYVASAVPATTKLVFAEIEGEDGFDSNNSTIVNTSINSESITLTSDYTTGPTDHVYLKISANINHSSNVTVTILDLYITYHW